MRGSCSDCLDIAQVSGRPGYRAMSVKSAFRRKNEGLVICLLLSGY